MKTDKEYLEIGKKHFQAWCNQHIPKNYCAIMELVGPWNRIVVSYKEVTLYHTGTRNLTTGEEENLDLGIRKPKSYPLHTLGEVIEAAKILPFSEEGYVVVDSQWGRNKIKSPQYVAAHRLKDNGNVNPNRVLELIKTNEQEEFLSYFPEYKEHFDRVKAKFDATMISIMDISYHVKKIKEQFLTRKEFALEVLKKSEKLRKYYFAFYDGNDDKVQKMVADLDYEDLL